MVSSLESGLSSNTSKSKHSKTSVSNLAVGFVEFCTAAVLVQVAGGETDRDAGDYKLDPLQFLKGKTEDEVKKMKTREIANGRLAMLAFGGVATQTALEAGNHAFPYF